SPSRVKEQSCAARRILFLVAFCRRMCQKGRIADVTGSRGEVLGPSGWERASAAVVSVTGRQARTPSHLPLRLPVLRQPCGFDSAAADCILDIDWCGPPGELP